MPFQKSRLLAMKKHLAHLVSSAIAHFAKPQIQRVVQLGVVRKELIMESQDPQKSKEAFLIM